MGLFRVGGCRFGSWSDVTVVVEEFADAIAGVGQDGQGAALVPGDVDGALGVVADAGDGPAGAGLEVGVGVVGGDQPHPVARSNGHSQHPFVWPDAARRV